MNQFDAFGLPAGRAICYSGFRDGQQPGGKCPSYDEILEDLQMLQGHFKYLRLYDVDEHGDSVLQVIEKENLDFKVMLGAYIVAEMNNYNCPWDGGVYSKEQLAANREHNLQCIKRLITMANQHPGIVKWLSVGNEACVEWTDHYVPPEKVIQYASEVMNNCIQPVTFCENYLPWLHALEGLANQLDFISIHSYPVWEYKHINEGIAYTKANYYDVAEKYPDKIVAITEAGWATNSNGRGIMPHNVNEINQQAYFNELMEWADKENILCFFFEAFDENWKGSPDPLEPEKHWGLFTTTRKPKLAASHMIPQGVSC